MLVLKLADQTVSSSSVSIETRAQTDSGLHSTNVSALPACSELDSLPRLQKLSDACHDKVQWKCFIKCIKWKITEEKLAQYVLFTCQCLFFLKSSSNGLKKKKYFEYVFHTKILNSDVRSGPYTDTSATKEQAMGSVQPVWTLSLCFPSNLSWRYWRVPQCCPPATHSFFLWADTEVHPSWGMRGVVWHTAELCFILLARLQLDALHLSIGRLAMLLPEALPVQCQQNGKV